MNPIEQHLNEAGERAYAARFAHDERERKWQVPWEDLPQDTRQIWRNVALAVMQTGKLVHKISGYKFRGDIRSSFVKRDGSPRVAVENDDGLLHIFNPEQLKEGLF